MPSDKGRSAGEFKSEFNPDQEVLALREQVKDLHRQLKAEKVRTGQARLQTIQVAEAVDALTPAKMRRFPSGDADAPVDYVVHLTDLHMGETVDANEVEGFNTFNPDVFHQRLELLANKVIHELAIQRSKYDIPRVHVIGTGDYISGDIHQELQVTNAFPAPVQAVRAGDEIAAFCALLAPHAPELRVDLLTNDNHGRLTRRNQFAQGGQNNYGYVVASIVDRAMSAHKNVAVTIHDGLSMLLPIGAEVYLAFHGHQIKGWAGLPYYGFDRRVMNESVKRLGREGAHFTKLLLGHFHVAVDALYWQVGGSLSGTNAFDHGNGRHARAHQTSWLVHPEHGQFGFTRWWL